MTISIEDKILNQERFENENELQGYLERCPYLLVEENEPVVKSVQREVPLPSAGVLDLLLVDESGAPIAVEVKLSRNGQSRREVVAQAFDYVSDLSNLTVDELDDIVDGSLEETLRDFNSELNLWKSCGVNLRAGIIKVVIAVDEVNDDLRRIVQYINEHSDLDVRLVSIKKYDNGKILVPNIVVSGNGIFNKKAKNKSFTPGNPVFESVIDTYNKTIGNDELKTRGRAKNYRQVRFDKWPSGVHYEFLDYKRTDEISVELHLESNKVRYLSSLLQSYAGDEINGRKIEWDAKWSNKRGRIRVRFPSDSGSSVIAGSMKSLIEKTSTKIYEKLTNATT